MFSFIINIVDKVKAKMLEINRLYPQYNIIQERRQTPVSPVSPIAYERRSGVDRRADDRVKLDTTLTRDIFEIKSKVAQIQKTAPKTAEKMTFTQNMPQAAQNAIKTDQFIKSTKTDSENSPKPIPKPDSQAGAIAGMLAVVLGGTMASTLLGVAGVGIAIGLGAYFGGKFLKSTITSHMKDK